MVYPLVPVSLSRLVGYWFWGRQIQINCWRISFCEGSAVINIRLFSLRLSGKLSWKLLQFRSPVIANSLSTEAKVRLEGTSLFLPPGWFVNEKDHLTWKASLFILSVLQRDVYFNLLSPHSFRTSDSRIANLSVLLGRQDENYSIGRELECSNCSFSGWNHCCLIRNQL